LLKVLSGVSWPTRRLSWDSFFVSLLGIVLARAVLMGQLYPFGASFLAGVCISRPEQKRFALLGVMLGTLVTIKGLVLLGYLGSLVILYSVFLYYKKETLHWLIMPALIFAIHLLTRGSIVFLSEGEPYLWVAIFFESFFVAVLTMVIISGMEVYAKVREGNILTAEERTSLGLIILGVLVGIAGFSFFGCGLQSVVSRWLVLWGAFLGGPGGGAAIGAAVGLTPSVQGVVTLSPVAYYALAGLLGGIFSSFKKSGVIVGFALGNLLLSFFFTEDLVITQALKETGVAVLAFLFLKLPFNSERIMAAQQPFQGSAEGVNFYYADRFSKMAQLFYDLEKIFHDHSAPKMEKNELNFLFNKVTSQVCGGCSLKRVCWEQDFYKTYRAILEVCTKLEAEGSIGEKDFGIDLKRRCMRLRELSVALNAQLEGLKIVHAYEKRLEVCHGIVNRQLIGLARIVEDFSAEIKKEVKDDENSGELLAKKMAEKGLHFKKISVVELSDGEKEIQLTQSPCENGNWCASMVAPNVSQILERTFILKNRHCEDKRGKGFCAYSLVPSRTLQIAVGKAYCPKEGVTISGDLCSALTLPNHQFALIMCDGMGVGSEAQAESSSAVSILEKLLLAGFSPQMAVRTVNTALLLKSPRENFAALDLVIINQINGQCDFIKIGGVPSLIRSDNGLKVVKASSLPVGILEDVQPQTYRHMLKAPNSIILMSDGIWDIFDGVEGPKGWLEGLLEQVDGSDPQTLADYLLFIAKKAAGNLAPDDMCVLVANLQQRNSA